MTNEKKNTTSKVIPKSRDGGIEENTYWLTRIVFLRSVAFLYFMAFLVAFDQNKELLGKNGLLPADKYLQKIKSHFGSSNFNTAFMNVPTVLLYTNSEYIDWWLDTLALSGIALSVVVFIAGAANMLLMFALWILYHSIVNIGQTWYSFGWESQLLETGFLAIFFCPLFSMKSLPEKTTPPIVVIWGYRWLIFRIMLGAGLIKIRGDQCWRDLTCMNYHYQTQPVPNPISYYLHQSPEVIHKFETLSNHFIELIVPFFILLTRKARLVGGFLQILFQVVLIISGNLSFLNWLTILPSIACFDDRCLSFMFSSSTNKKVRELNEEVKHSKITWGRYIRQVLNLCLAVLLATLSIPVVQNLLSSRQAMNTSFETFRIVNTYGAFGSITKTRTEVILQGTRNTTIIPDEHGGRWEEFEFKCKPGDVRRRPCLITPYHYRLDWLMWFAAFMNYQQNPWLIHLSAKLLKNDRNVTRLLAYNPFIDGDPPIYIRAEHYEYTYTKIGSKTAPAQWWKRKRIGTYFPVVDLKTLRPYIRNNGWKI